MSRDRSEQSAAKVADDGKSPVQRMIDHFNVEPVDVTIGVGRKEVYVISSELIECSLPEG